MQLDVPGLQFKTSELTGPEVLGSAIHIDGKFAIVSASPLRRFTLAIFDGEQGKFRLSNYQQQTVLFLGSELLCEPDLTSPSEYRAPGPASLSECYYDGSGLYVRVHLDPAPQEWPMLWGAGCRGQPKRQCVFAGRLRLDCGSDRRMTPSPPRPPNNLRHQKLR
jgi:hypothetical protein